MDYFQSFLDATPERGVITVEYYWQPRTGASPTQRSGMMAGASTSMVFFKRILTTAECWCGSKRRFSRCHRREDDWTYVTLDPDHAAYSPVVLLERRFGNSNPERLCKIFEREPGLLAIEHTDSLTAWGVPAEPPLLNESGQLILGTIGIGQNQVHLETNSEKRFAYLLARFQDLLGDEAGDGSTLRAEPQKSFVQPAPSKRRKRGHR
jgi:hypothetical protein